jgi:hypothetical protein
MVKSFFKYHREPLQIQGKKMHIIETKKRFHAYTKDELVKMVQVGDLEEKAIINPDDANKYMLSQGHDSYLIPDEFKGSVVFSTRFIKGLAP